MINYFFLLIFIFLLLVIVFVIAFINILHVMAGAQQPAADPSDSFCSKLTHQPSALSIIAEVHCFYDFIQAFGITRAGRQERNKAVLEALLHVTQTRVAS